ncbi:uncharacterized protein PG998_007333 [Apiospora kogelbergensis]|uniref:Uncharacterized protein n=1 Tax=Apiospora kogelbergensis TaxID=1337665 RepID=A0AAW0QPX7_9PEZI
MPVRNEELEQPTSLLHRARALANAAYPGKRRLTNAYDERVCKRRNTDSLFGTPWDAADNGLEKPGYESLLTQAVGDDHSPAGNPIGVNAFVAHLANNANDGRADVGITGNFGKLPSEVREEIFKQVLVHDQPISVLRGWSLVYIRDRPRLEAQLLRVCRDFYEVGVPVLYGSNTFHYKNRDPPGSHRDTNAVVNKVFQTPGFTIPIDKYGHLFRNIHVSIEPNRMHSTEIRENVAKALQKFVPGHGLHQPARLRRVIVQVPLQTRGELKMKTTPAAGSRDVPSQDFFKRGSRVFQVLEKLNCQFIEVVGEPKRADGMYFRAVIDRRPHFTQQSVDAGHEDIWANDAVAIANRKREFATSKARFGLIGHWIRHMTLDPFRHLGPDALFQPYVPPVYTKPLHSIKTKYRNYKDKDGWSFIEHEAAVAGPSHQHGVVTRSRGHNVTMRTPITTYSASSEADIDEDAHNYAELDSDSSPSSSEDESDFGDYDEEYMDATVTNDD